MNQQTNKRLNVALFLLTMIVASFSHAGTSCTDTSKNPQVHIAAAKQAVALNQQLNRTGAKVVLVSRVGSDLSKYNMHYSHVGYAVKDYPGRPGTWTVVHLLNQCGTAKSTINAQGLMNFFLDDLYNMDFMITVPTPSLQAKLDKELRTSLINRMHDRRYNMLSYPFSTRNQNSNQWVIELLEATKDGLHSRQAAQEKLLANGYRPSMIKLDGFTKLGASMFRSNIRFDDHPSIEQKTNNYSIVTVDSVINYLRKQGLVQANIDVRGNSVKRSV